ncbi:energy transducer TonB [Sulfurovum sp.]|jgi:protein TonB|uniref:energy transducer TonB n=1 Tax=Sulfurovum sp. TaxID=1969726 RepID=UPI002A35921B|nr:energy transducer TonB [Sulfurovum sp.]MDY0403249.1 energy transducer TonB [Sulfurovum sp.]
MAREKFNKERARNSALLAMAIGALLMMVLVVSFNGKVEKQEKKVKDPMRYVKMEKLPPKVEKPKPKPKSKPKAQPQAPLPDLGAMLGGLAMNIPEFATGDIIGDGRSLLGDVAADTAMSEGTVDSKPRVVSRTPLEYPAAAAKKRIKGYVVVNLLIGKDGSVELAKVIASNPAGVFDQAALRGVRGWRFAPAKYKGNPVKVWAKQKVRFDLN